MEASVKTGILYDALTLKHKCGGGHPERPKRVQSIIEHFRTKHYLDLPRIQFIQKLTEASMDVIGLVHDKKYTDYVNNIWDPKKHKKAIQGDTYFNQHSNVASHLAVGGVLAGVDNIMNKRWRNAFAVVRPPGHHSGVKNVISGFCIYNNVAIGVHYLRKKYNKVKIAIFDWDVHHGDGTQHVFRQDPNTLFISLHRYDNGSFYPGESGSCQNVGQGPAEGKQLNVSWNTVGAKYRKRELMPGDNEYIYIFERALFPILKQFNPQFIFISAGFDSARGDPLGGLSVGPEAYNYMTSKLLTLAPVLVVLEGGYNLKSISLAAESVLCALIGKEGPRETTLKHSEMKDRCWLPQYYHQNLDQVIGVFQKYWPVLNNQKLLNYQKGIKANKERVFGDIKQQQQSWSSQEQQNEKEEQIVQKNNQPQQKKSTKQDNNYPTKNYYKEEVPDKDRNPTKDSWKYYMVAGHLDIFRVQNDRFFKIPKVNELNFYEGNSIEKKFAPKYYGFNGKQIILEYMMFGMQNPNVMDIKVGGIPPFGNPAKIAYQLKKFEASTGSTLGFRICGYVNSEQRVLKRDIPLTKDQVLIKKIIASVIPPQHIKQVIQFVNDLSATLKLSSKNKYYTASIFIVSGKQLRVRWIDFAYMEPSDRCDEEIIKGLDNLSKCLTQL